LVELGLFSLALSLSIPIVAACKRHVAEWGWWSLLLASVPLAALILYCVAVVVWFNRAVAWAGWTVLAWLSLLLAANAWVMVWERGVRGAANLILPAIVVGGFWTLCMVANAIFKRFAKT
jgi:hypothetical protein